MPVNLSCPSASVFVARGTQRFTDLAFLHPSSSRHRLSREADSHTSRVILHADLRGISNVFFLAPSLSFEQLCCLATRSHLPGSQDTEGPRSRAGRMWSGLAVCLLSGLGLGQSLGSHCTRPCGAARRNRCRGAATSKASALPTSQTFQTGSVSGACRVDLSGT